MTKRKRQNKAEPQLEQTTTLLENAGGRKDTWVENAVYIVIITILFIAVYGYIFDKKLDLNGDNAYYYVLGKALSQGDGYVNIASINSAANNHYPPGYPFILSIFMKFSDSFTFLKILNGIFLLISLYLAYYLFNKFSNNPKIAFLSTFFLLLNAHVLLYSTMIMSEISFILFSFLCLALIINIDFKVNIFKNPYTYLTLITLAIAYYIRSSGLALFGGLILYLLIKKHWNAVAFFMSGFFVLALPWIIRGRKLGGNAYVKPLVMINPYRPELGNADIADYFNRFFSNVSRYITREIPSSTLPFIKVNYLDLITITEWIIGFVFLKF